MIKKYDVIWSNIAENDLKNIVEYIADDSPPNALNKKLQAFIPFLKEDESSRNCGIKGYFNIGN